MVYNFAEFKVVFFTDRVVLRKVHFFKNSFNKSLITLFVLILLTIAYNYLFTVERNFIELYILIAFLIILVIIFNLFLMSRFKIIIKDNLVELRKFKNLETIESIEYLYVKSELVSLRTLAYGVRNQYTLFVKNNSYLSTELTYFIENNNSGISKNSETLRQVCNLINEKFNLHGNSQKKNELHAFPKANRKRTAKK